MTTRRGPRRSGVGDVTLTNVNAYSQDTVTWIAKGERQFFDLFLETGMSVLDLGCGTGRITRELVRRELRVWACDLNPLALNSLRASLDSSSAVIVKIADARELPFENEFFDAVVVAFNGLDYVYPESDRLHAVVEISRVLRPGGVFIFSSHNPIGTVLSPRGVRSAALLRWRLHYLVSGRVLSRYFRDPNGLLLYQALPRRIILDVVKSAPLEFERAINCSGATERLPLLSMFSGWPYYAFRKGR